MAGTRGRVSPRAEVSLDRLLYQGLYLRDIEHVLVLGLLLLGWGNHTR
ncbi:hypothetical protein [Streptomyces sp. B93]|nr:hypothetical protein [Streptomyces sp. B93]MBQ1093899.1 hypothetical protein [Streptomyces sp. B93]